MTSKWDDDAPMPSPRKRSREERDFDVDSTYHLTPAILVVLGGSRDVLGAICANAVRLAELFFEEMGPATGSLDMRLALWAERHFGRELEPAAAGILKYEIRRRLLLRDGGRVGPPVGVFKDTGEEGRWLDAEGSVPALRPGEPMEARLHRICVAAGVNPGPGPRSMPEAREPGEDAE